MRLNVHHLPLRVFDPERQLRESGRRPRGVCGLKVSSKSSNVPKVQEVQEVVAGMLNFYLT